MIHVTVRGNRRLLNCQIRFVLIDQHGISQLDNTAKTAARNIQYP